jgi:hypothetical protein
MKTKYLRNIDGERWKCYNNLVKTLSICYDKICW